MEDYSKLIATTLQIPLQSVKNTLALLNEGATIPFIARYRKESTGSLDLLDAIAFIGQQCVSTKFVL